MLEALKYPIGKFIKPELYTENLLNGYITTIRDFPAKLRHEVFALDQTQLDTPYRPDGWTIRQVVHHCADSHMNAFIRFKLTLTEDNPTTIRPYVEHLWAKLPDGVMPIEPSLKIVEGVHARMTVLWASLSEQDLNKKYVHPQYLKEFTLSEAMGLYDWHSRHHLAHITTLKKSKNW